MTGERPDDAREPDGTAGPADGDDGLEARRASGSDAPFHGLRSAADIFGAPRGEEDWPSRRERREAERTARETGAPLPEPFVADADAEAADPAADAPAADAPAAPVLDDGATQAISMPAELLAPSENPDAAVEHERSTLHDRIPAAADVPPDSTAPHPSSIVLPTAQTHRDERAAASKAIEDERRRVDPFGEGRADVDWLGRATGSHPEPVAPAAPQPLGVENVLPPTEEPPTFTDLLRITSTGPVPTQTGGHDRPFDWAIHDDQAGEVPATLTTDSFDTTALATGSWSLADESDDEDEVVAGEVDTPADGLPQAPRTYPVPPAVPVPPVVPPAVPAAGAAAAVAAGAGSSDASEAAEPTEAVEAPRGPAGDDVPDATEGLQSDAPTTALPAAGTPWWSEPDATVPPTAAPPLVQPAADEPSYPAHLPPSVGQDLDAVLGLRGNDTGPQPESLPAAAPEDLDQSEWDGRETSDTSAIKDLFGTEAVGQLGGTGYDPEDTGTRMMPAAAVPAAAAPAPAPVAPAASRSAVGAAGGPDREPGERDNFINEGFARLRNEGKRGKQLLIWGSIALILVLIVLVFLLSKWILGNNIADQAVPTKSPAAASSAPATPTAAPSESASQPSDAAAPGTTLQFATTPALPGEHAWTDLAGGECLSPFTNAWSQTFTVVDCATPHIGQLTARLAVEGDTYPGAEALATQAADQCQSDAALNASAAAAVGDVQVQGSYAPDQATWDQGNRFISCFVTRSSGQPLTGSLAPGA
ncbi:septum formation family protein [Curtobacterium aurantiacum]|uniref:Septum formation family protein n=1 Tax=Curtobacterium aurantiacum TaxID=3236919 RepID=A0ABS5VCD1_9MICO|nr:septum formation family protein [Curtobacterium flaccumfaciens]MBT1544272.1 septum formation family protein [Curtobacterium flaccumfaciens pv. flaccumfaciens]MBT1587149.1 septum formation family protein [Curtobacterium flaccumfaciens pv. flaccumfaciens]